MVKKLQHYPLELVIAILEFVPSRDLCRFLSLSKELEYEIHKILIERVHQKFVSGQNCLLATIEPLDMHGPGPTHIFDLVLLDTDVSSLDARFKINDASFTSSSNKRRAKSSSSSSTILTSKIKQLQPPLPASKIIGRKLTGTERWETILQNACINLESTWRPFLDPSQLIKNVTVHVFSPFDVDHETIYVTNGKVTFTVDVETIGWWERKIDTCATIVMSNSLREFGDLESFLVTAFVEEVLIKAGILLTAIEERWKDDVASVVIEKNEESV
ncbi:4526_t:CDS:2 [Ambispora gerdemannii]|uniref:4526_t:CDS:1 n=1 Tax=Ambispora gerdemannii TaxID=144530 RepID=A0A9N8VQA0_9GLOM|nr:4526_t:CDS:2 [Ambispora gerdemannii]